MKKYTILYVTLILVLFAGCTEKKRHYEKYYQIQLCDALDGVREQSLLDRTRIDCLTDEYAIEVDFAKKWAEAIGQSLHYAHMTDKKPAIGFIVGSSKADQRHLKRLEVLADKYDIKIFKIKREE